MLSKFLLGTSFVGHNVWNQGKIIYSLFPYLKGHFEGGTEKKSDTDIRNKECKPLRKMLGVGIDWRV